MRYICIVASWGFSLLFLSCNGSISRQANIKSIEVSPMAYAELFTLDFQEEYTTVTVFNPWKNNEVYVTYHLVKQDDIHVPPDGQKIVIPLNNMMTNSATHLGFLDLLGITDRVCGVCSADFVYTPSVRTGIESGKVKDLGDAFNLDIEQLLLLQPQAVMTTAYNADDENSKKMRQTGLTLLYNIEWQEKSLLGRAEWIKFIAAFFDKSSVADSIFHIVETQYNEIKKVADQSVERPTILSGQDFRGSWSMPGGESFNAQLFKDAGGSYYHQDNKTRGSIQSTIEEALVHFGKADVWVGVQVNTLEELSKLDRKNTLFNAYQKGNVYNNNKRINTTGGNDYWEGAVARPDLLLSDMVKILHPELLPGYKLTYLQKIN